VQAAWAAEPAAADAKPEAAAADAKPAEPKPAEKKPEVDIDTPAATPAAPKTTSERKAATADEYSPKEASGGGEVADEKYGHGMQVGLRAGLVGGYRMIFRYDKSPYCHAPDPSKGGAKDQQKFCGNAAPFALDLALSFGVLDFAEPFLWARFGLKGEASTNTKELMALGVGARIYTNSDSKFKIFVEPAVGAELEGGAGNPDWKYDGANPDYKTDFLFHLGVGPQYDFARAFGAYANFGLTTGVLRYIHTSVEASIGVQVRVP
jgi:hypothetical protein